jgi:hypothetical protein
MAVEYYTQRPRAQATVTWSGTNAAEVRGFLYSGVTLIVDAAGAGSINRYGTVTAIPVGAILTPDGNVLDASWQKLPAAVASYTVTAG